MKWLDQLDDKFVSLASDDEERRLELARLRGRRVYYLGLGLLNIIGSAALKVTGHDMGWGFAMFGLYCICLGYKCEADIRMLKIIERSQEGKGLGDELKP